jgi:cytochrome d ubiquinol oxidase subunit II
MSAAEAVAGAMWIGVTCYALFGGADFGGGAWDLMAGSARRGDRQRRLIEHSIGPVWEANHVWLIFVLVVMWTGFPGVFGAVASTLYIPLTIAALGVIARGSAFAFRKTVVACWPRRAFGTVFATSSIITPFFLGAAAGAVASGRVPPGVGSGSPVSSWWNPFAVICGALAVAGCAYLAAVYLTAEARRAGDHLLICQFRGRAIGASAVFATVAVAGLAVAHRDAHSLYHGLVDRASPLLLGAGLATVVTLALLFHRSFVMSRISAALGVAAVLWAWAIALYPHIMPPKVTIDQAAANHTVLTATLVCLVAGAVLVIPSLVWLYRLSERCDDHMTSSNRRGHGDSRGWAVDQSVAPAEDAVAG